jgi:hypothetical protein
MMQEGRATQEANTEIALNKEKMRQKSGRKLNQGVRGPLHGSPHEFQQF